MAVIFSFGRLFRSLLPGVRVRHAAQTEPVENGNSVLPLPPQTSAEAHAARLEVRREAKHRKRRNRAERNRLARLAAIEVLPVAEAPAQAPARVPVYGSQQMLMQARELFALGFLPSAAVCCRIAFEGHLRRLCEDRGIRIGRSPRLADIIDLLVLHGFYDNDEKSVVVQQLKIANGAAHGCVADWWEVHSLIAFVACTISTLGLSQGGTL